MSLLAFNTILYCGSKCLYSFTYYVRQYCSMNLKYACVLLAPGTEELECVTQVDVLRRGGLNVTVAGLYDNKPVTCRFNMTLVPDMSLKDARAHQVYDVIVLPGGLQGAKNFSNSEELGEFLQKQENANRYIAAICAAPIALKAHSIGFGKNITSYPAMETMLKDGRKYIYRTDKPVIIDGKLITSRGPGTAMLFAVTIIDVIMGRKKAEETAGAMLFKYG